MEEMECISKAFEDAQEQNGRLLKTLADKEEAATKLMADRLRGEQSISLLQAERQ